MPGQVQTDAGKAGRCMSRTRMIRKFNEERKKRKGIIPEYSLSQMIRLILRERYGKYWERILAVSYTHLTLPTTPYV